MAEDNKRRRKVQRQNWQPHWLARALYRIWKIAFSAFKIAAGTVATVLLICIVCGFVFVTILGDYLQDDVMAKAEINLDNYTLEKTSYIYYEDADGNYQILQQLNTTTDRRWVAYEDIPEELIHAAVAIEDKRFYEHQGVDWITTAKACLNMFFGGSSQFGGSTLTQQLVKNILLMDDENADDVTVQRKILEIFRALAFEKTYDKDVVIEYYMNTVFFGSGCYGVKSAAEYYFGKELQDMNTAELAALIGITNNPSMFNPYSTRVYTYEGEERDGAGRNRYRQQVVLTQMHVQGWLTEEEYLEAYDYELVYKRGIDDEDRWNTCKGVYNEEGEQISYGCGYEGPVRDLIVQENETGTVYYCPNCKQQIDITIDASKSIYSWYVDTVLEDVAKELAARDGVTEWNKKIRQHYVDLICRSGYHIYTPYDATVQAAVDRIYTDLEEIPAVKSGQQLQSGIVIVDNRTGDIVAMAGGVGEKTVADAYNRTTDAKLQIGSSIKPLTVYVPAFEAGLITPATIIDDLPMMYNNGSPYPLNEPKGYRYHRTVWSGIVNSVNTISVNTLDMIGTRYSFNFAKNQLGLSTLTDHYVTESGRVLTDVGIAALGMGALTEGVTVRDVTSAYATFANDGVYREGRTFTVVLNDEGSVVLRNEQDSRQVVSQKALDYINYCLDSAVQSGTGKVADMFSELGMDVAGKTGSTQSNKDRYFSGFTGHYTAAVWCGFDTPEEIVLDGVTTNPAARLWKKVMLQIHEGLQTIPLYHAENMEKITVCLDSGLLATEACRNDIRTTSSSSSSRRYETVMVYPEDAPTKFCDHHVTMDYCTTGSGVANEYCQLFAKYGAIKLEEKVLLKITQATWDELLLAKDCGLSSMYLKDNYVYLVDSNGNDATFHGYYNNLNKDVSLPYKGCKVHTQLAWEQYKAEHPWIDGGSAEPEPEPTTPEPTTPEPSGTEPGTTTPGAEQPPEGGNDNNNWWEDLWDSITGQ